jgi:hypothetical protein
MPASLMGPPGKVGQSVSRLNVLIAITAALIGLIYGNDLLYRERAPVPHSTH